MDQRHVARGGCTVRSEQGTAVTSSCSDVHDRCAQVPWAAPETQHRRRGRHAGEPPGDSWTGLHGGREPVRSCCSSPSAVSGTRSVRLHRRRFHKAPSAFPNVRLHKSCIQNIVQHDLILRVQQMSRERRADLNILSLAEVFVYWTRASQ